MLTVHQTPAAAAAAAQCEHMFIDVSGCSTVHNTATERKQHLHAGEQTVSGLPQEFFQVLKTHRIYFFWHRYHIGQHEDPRFVSWAFLCAVLPVSVSIPGLFRSFLHSSSKDFKNLDAVLMW